MREEEGTARADCGVDSSLMAALHSFHCPSVLIRAFEGLLRSGEGQEVKRKTAAEGQASGVLRKVLVLLRVADS